jgi:hypothetical protein
MLLKVPYIKNVVHVHHTTSAVISDTPAGHIFTEVYPQLDWCLWIDSISMVKAHFTLFYTVAAYFCLHTGDIL